jgi:hypothetical protein
MLALYTSGAKAPISMALGGTAEAVPFPKTYSSKTLYIPKGCSFQLLFIKEASVHFQHIRHQRAREVCREALHRWTLLFKK